MVESNFKFNICAAFSQAQHNKLVAEHCSIYQNMWSVVKTVHIFLNATPILTLIL